MACYSKLYWFGAVLTWGKPCTVQAQIEVPEVFQPVPDVRLDLGNFDSGLTFAVHRYKTFFPCVVGEISPTLIQMSFYTTYTVGESWPMTFTSWSLHGLYQGWKITHDFNMVKLSRCWLCGTFFSLQNITSPTYLISCRHVEKRNTDEVMAFYCCGSKIEGVEDF